MSWLEDEWVMAWLILPLVGIAGVTCLYFRAPPEKRKLISPFALLAVVVMCMIWAPWLVFFSLFTHGR